MERLLWTEKGRKAYGKRKETIEPVPVRSRTREAFEDFFSVVSITSKQNSSSSV